MDDKPICYRCRSEIYHHQGTAHYGYYIAHRSPDDCTVYLNRKIQELEARLAEQEWRPVTEPPQMADNYHVWRRPGYHDFCHFNGVNWRTTGGDSVTHWRPLPAPPLTGES